MGEMGSNWANVYSKKLTQNPNSSSPTIITWEESYV